MSSSHAGGVKQRSVTSADVDESRDKQRSVASADVDESRQVDFSDGELDEAPEKCESDGSRQQTEKVCHGVVCFWFVIIDDS